MRRVIGPRSSTRCPSSVWSFMTWPTPLSMITLQIMSVPSGPRMWAALPSSRSEVNLVEWVHGDPRKDLEGPVDVAAPQQVVDGLGAGGVGPLRIARPVGEEVAEPGARQERRFPSEATPTELGVRRGAAVPVRGGLRRVLRFHVGSRRVIA